MKILFSPLVIWLVLFKCYFLSAETRIVFHHLLNILKEIPFLSIEILTLNSNQFFL